MIYINDIEVDLNNTFAKFADDTKIGNIVFNDVTRLIIQNSLKLGALVTTNVNVR